MEKGVGGTLQPISIDEDNRTSSTEEVLHYFRSQVISRYDVEIQYIAMCDEARAVVTNTHLQSTRGAQNGSYEKWLC